MKRLNSKFEILSYSDSQYEKLTVEVQFDGEPLLQINQDKGIENLEIELFKSQKDLRFSFTEFIEILRISKGYL